MSRYRVRLRADVEQAMAEFPGIEVQAADGVVSLSGNFDQAALHGVLDRVHFLGYELIDVVSYAPLGPRGARG